MPCVCNKPGVICDHRYCSIASETGDNGGCIWCWFRLGYNISYNNQHKFSSQRNPTAVSMDCKNLGLYTGKTIQCGSCVNKSMQKIFSCNIHGTCSIDREVPGIVCCINCEDYQPKAMSDINQKRGILKWSYGITTVTERRKDLLPKTLESLRLGGFDKPHLFVDGTSDGKSWEDQFQLDVTCRKPRVRTAGNWVLSMYELYYLNPTADRFAIFQDDMLTYRNLRQYLEIVPYPIDGYLNLYTFPSNHTIARGRKGWYHSNQFGRGAVALVFNKDVVMKLLSAWHMVERVQDPHRGAYKAIDGGIVDSLKSFGIKEYVHNPSLTFHTGIRSAMDNPPHAQTDCFLGESFDALSLEPMVHS